jgi:hypothetical protein
VGASPARRPTKTRQLVPRWGKLYLQLDLAGVPIAISASRAAYLTRFRNAVSNRITPRPGIIQRRILASPWILQGGQRIVPWLHLEPGGGGRLL